VYVLYSCCRFLHRRFSVSSIETQKILKEHRKTGNSTFTKLITASRPKIENSSSLKTKTVIAASIVIDHVSFLSALSCSSVSQASNSFSTLLTLVRFPSSCLNRPSSDNRFCMVPTPYRSNVSRSPRSILAVRIRTHRIAPTNSGRHFQDGRASLISPVREASSSRANSLPRSSGTFGSETTKRQSLKYASPTKWAGASPALNGVKIIGPPL
jgi:hypothetical protein